MANIDQLADYYGLDVRLDDVEMELITYQGDPMSHYVRESVVMGTWDGSSNKGEKWINHVVIVNAMIEIVLDEIQGPDPITFSGHQARLS